MDMTQIVLAIVGSIAVWALKSVIELQRTQTKLEGEIQGLQAKTAGEIQSLRNGSDSERAHLNYRLDELKIGLSDLKLVISTLAAHNRQER